MNQAVIVELGDVHMDGHRWEPGQGGGNVS